MTIKLNENERLDDLILDGMKLIQRNDEFCFSLDTVLLARFGDVIKGPTLDLGTGTAAIPLILSARGACGTQCGAERKRELCCCSQRRLSPHRGAFPGRQLFRGLCQSAVP